jgi:hypothetical protein
MRSAPGMGWSKWTGAVASAACGVMFSPTLGAARSSKRTPYISLNSGTLLRLDGSANTDAGTAFQAYIRSKPWVFGTLSRLKRLMEAVIVAKASSSTLTQSVIKDFGASTATSTVSLAAAGSETHVRKKYDADRCRGSVGRADSTRR